MTRLTNRLGQYKERTPTRSLSPTRHRQPLEARSSWVHTRLGTRDSAVGALWGRDPALATELHRDLQRDVEGFAVPVGPLPVRAMQAFPDPTWGQVDDGQRPCHDRGPVVEPQLVLAAFPGRDRVRSCWLRRPCDGPRAELPRGTAPPIRGRHMKARRHVGRCSGRQVGPPPPGGPPQADNSRTTDPRLCPAGVSGAAVQVSAGQGRRGRCIARGARHHDRGGSA